jgi:hypothetical protein
MAEKGRQRKQSGGRGRRAAKVRRVSEADRFALPVEVVRRLVARIVARQGVEPFVSGLLPLIDGLRAGRTNETARAARGGGDRQFRRLASAIGRVAGRGEFVAARNTAILAASYAYQESLDYVCKLFDYLDRVREQSRAGAGKNRAGRV